MPVVEPDFDDMMIFPITDIDGTDEEKEEETSNNNALNNRPSNGLAFQPVMTLRQRRHSKLGLGADLSKLQVNIQRNLSKEDVLLESESPSPKVRWMRAFRKLRRLKDPWAKFHIDDLLTETAIRHRYNALKKSWSTDTVHIKMETKVSIQPKNLGKERVDTQAFSC